MSNLDENGCYYCVDSAMGSYEMPALKFCNCSAGITGHDGIVFGDKLACGSNSYLKTQPPCQAVPTRMSAE